MVDFIGIVVTGALMVLAVNVLTTFMDIPRAAKLTIVGGDEDWAPRDERERTRSLIPGVVMEAVRNGNHFLPLDRPQGLLQFMTCFAGQLKGFPILDRS